MTIPASLRSAVLCLAALTALPLPAFQNASVLTNDQAKAQYRRTLELMESAGFAMPPSLRMRQKCTIMKIPIATGRNTQCRT